MATPAQVKQAGIEADEALKQLTEGLNQPAAPVEPPLPKVEMTPPPSVPDTPAPTAPAAPAPTAQPTTPETELARLRQELLTAQGRNNAQDREVAELRGRLDTLMQTINKAPPAPPAPQAPPKNLITDEDRKDYGEDLIDFIQRVIQQAVGNAVANLANRMSVVEGQVKQATNTVENVQTTVAESRFDRYLRELDETVPGWRDTNEDPKYVDWLKKADTFSQKPLHELLADAHNKADAKRVATFFKAYWEETGTAPAAPAASAPAAPAAAPPTPAAPSIDPATLVAPTPAATPAPSASAAKGRIWTEKEISDAYDDRVRGRVTPDEFAKTEAEINRAVLEGRVR